MGSYRIEMCKVSWWHLVPKKCLVARLLLLPLNRDEERYMSS